MKAIQLTKYVKSSRELTISNITPPEPRPNEYVIAIYAAAANFFDILQTQGKYQIQPPFPWVAGYEFAGVVLSVPQRLTSAAKFPVGARVFGAAQGAYATRICVAEESLMPVPEGWSFGEAAGLFVTVPTSYCALVVRAGIKKGDWVLVHAAAGGVGLAAVQSLVAKAFGAHVIATAGSERKLQVARSFGADHTVEYSNQNWPEQVRKLTPGGRGVDIVYDPVGLVDKCTKCVAWNGRILVVGFAAGCIEKLALNKVLLKNISVVGVHWGLYSKMERSTIATVWEGIMELIRNKRFRAPVFSDREYVGLEDIPTALEALSNRDTWGKVVINITQEEVRPISKL